MSRHEFKLSPEDRSEIIEAIKGAQSTPLLAVHCGMPQSPQEAANNAWRRLGERMGFDGMTVQASVKGDGFFTAESIS